MHKRKRALSLPRPLRVSICALLLALTCMLLTPLAALACGGMFSADAYTEQSAERLVFALGNGQVTLYEQIHYTGSPSDFAWVLPVPATPTVDTAPITLFRDLDQQTAPRFSIPAAPTCDSGIGSGAAAPQTSSAVNVYSSGTAGPYSYNVIGSSNPKALTQWLTSNHYKIPAESQTEMKPYIAAHMRFVALRLRGNAGAQDMTPVKITYASNQPGITIPLRMATPMGKEPLEALVWIFGQSRYVPQNYQSLQISSSQLSSTLGAGGNYMTLVNQAVSKANGHGFITEYAQPTSNLSPADPELADLQQHYSYVTRLHTSIAPSQINLDPTFVAQSGLPNVSPYHALTNVASSQPLICPPSTTTIASISLAVLLGITLIVIAFGALRRRKMPKD
jgi:hypothetical protein